MQTTSISYAGYWRNSLADAELGRGAFRDSDIKTLQRLSEKELKSGRAGSTILNACFAKEAQETQAIEVVIRPKVYMRRSEHGHAQRSGKPDVVTPVVVSALLARSGRLYPLPQAIVPRDILEPLERGHFSIGHVSDLDAFLSTGMLPGIDYTTGDDATPLSDIEFEQQWTSFLAGCDRLLQQVGHGWPHAEDHYELAEHGYLVKKDSFAGSRHILGLYDHIRSKSPSAPLFDRYASTDVAPPEPCLPEHAAFSLRLAHASDQFPLAPAQRNALTHLMVAKEAEILAVNGPPGTGKTTLLLSVVASLWAKAAMEDSEPPVVLAASTNNQPVTNIIDAFGKDFATGEGPLAGRWLPQVKSFGAYFPSADKAAGASTKYQTHDFFDAVESAEYVAEAQVAYLRAAAAAFPDIADDKLDIKVAVRTLRVAIQKESEKLTTLENTWSALSAARAAVLGELGEAPSVSMARRQQQFDAAAAEKRNIDDLAEQWERYLAQEPLLYTLFSWLPPVAKKRLRLARLFLKPLWPSRHAQAAWQTVEQIEGSIKALAAELDQVLQTHKRGLEHGEKVLRAEQDCLGRWRAALAPLGVSDNIDGLSITDCDPLADTRIRFVIFLLTTHYWEGRWLLEMQDLLPGLESERKKKGRITLEKRWRRWMKLTPCIVSTFFMLPKELQVSRHDGQGFVPDYLYHFADLLIVDEAGQVLPEVAGAAFALSKKALVIGDTLQIEPIWSIPVAVDIGNLLDAKLLPGDSHEDAYEQLTQLGKCVSAGSVMRVAQALTRYHQDPDLARGLFLYEHRRCFDQIISYCNTLCYLDKLIPKRGPKKDDLDDDDGLPAMGYLHIDGICQKNSNGSRQNLHEAETIAAWLAKHKDSLEAKYAQPLHKIVGVVTPFGGQVQAISNACRKAGIKVGNEDDGMTVGTVHSLQGAERPIVIFSSVYSKHEDGRFIDRSPSMLNVAVSRAKNTFLVFGDMDTFGLAPTAPRGLLATQLFGDPANALNFEYRPRQDLENACTGVRQLQDAKEHDAFLLETLATVAREVHIVTPWLIMQRIEEIGAFTAMCDAVRRGVDVAVYTDPALNAGNDPRKHQALMDAAGALRSAGIHIAFVERVHSKLVIGDDNLYCVGSFNWFSASRDEHYARHETSLVYRGPRLTSEIEVMQQSIKRRIIDQKTSKRIA